MGVVRLSRLLSLLFAMDLVIHAAAFGLGVKRADIKMPWEREPINPVFAKKPRLIQPPVFVPSVPRDDAEISIPVAEAQGVVRWSKATFSNSLAYRTEQSIGKSFGVMEDHSDGQFVWFHGWKADRRSTKGRSGLKDN